MKETSLAQLEKMIFKYVGKLSKQHKLDPKKDIFFFFFPLEKNQVICCFVGVDEDGVWTVEYTFYGQNYIMPKLKNTVLYEDKED